MQENMVGQHTSECQCDAVIDVKVKISAIEQRVNSMDEKVDVVSSDLKEINQKLDSVDRTLIVNTASLQEHMRQTNLLKKQQEKFHGRLETIEKSRERVSNIMWFVAKVFLVLSSAAGFIIAVTQLIKVVKS